VPASPTSGIDTITGDGLDNTLTGAAIVVDVSYAPAFDDAAVLDFFTTSTRNLLAAEAATGVTHHVALSIVGVDRPPERGYFRAKLAQETMIAASGIPSLILRATQFFEFIPRIADAATTGRDRHDRARRHPADRSRRRRSGARAHRDQRTRRRRRRDRRTSKVLDDLVQRDLAAPYDPRDVVTDPHAPSAGAELDEHMLVPTGHARIGTTDTRTGWTTPRPADPHPADVHYEREVSGAAPPRRVVPRADRSGAGRRGGGRPSTHRPRAGRPA
jgi:hypothetical protein